MATRRELDEVYRELHELKREMRTLRSASPKSVTPSAVKSRGGTSKRSSKR